MTVRYRSPYRGIAAPIIARVLQQHNGADERTLRRALYDAYPFAIRRYHPYRIWLDEIQRQRKRKPPLGTARPAQSRLADPRQITIYDALEESA